MSSTRKRAWGSASSESDGCAVPFSDHFELQRFWKTIWRRLQELSWTQRDGRWETMTDCCITQLDKEWNCPTVVSSIMSVRRIWRPTRLWCVKRRIRHYIIIPSMYGLYPLFHLDPERGHEVAISGNGISAIEWLHVGSGVSHSVSAALQNCRFRVHISYRSCILARLGGKEIDS